MSKPRGCKLFHNINRKLIAFIILQGFLVFDVSWACQGVAITQGITGFNSPATLSPQINVVSTSLQTVFNAEGALTQLQPEKYPFLKLRVDGGAEFLVVDGKVVYRPDALESARLSSEKNGKSLAQTKSSFFPMKIFFGTAIMVGTFLGYVPVIPIISIAAVLIGIGILAYVSQLVVAHMPVGLSHFINSALAVMFFIFNMSPVYTEFKLMKEIGVFVSGDAARVREATALELSDTNDSVNEENILLNPGFESGDSEWRNMWGSPGDVTSLSNHTSGGNYSIVHFVGSVDHQDYWNQLYQDISFSAGDPFYASVLLHK